MTKRSLTAAQQATAERRAALELTRARAAADLSRASAPQHRRMLEAALEALDSQLAALDRPS